MTQAPRICFDRPIPSNYQPARAMAQKAALSNYRFAVQGKAASKPGAARRANFARQVASLGKPLGTLSASDPVHIARMALINLKKWVNGYNLRCRFLDGDDFQKGKVQEKAQIWQDYANISVNFGDDPDAGVRISFQADSGSWS